MSILIGLLLSQAKILPEIDRRALDAQARVEATQPRRAAQPRRAVQPRAAVQSRPVTQPRRAAAQQPAVRQASAGGTLDLTTITTICRAAGNHEDPAQFLATLARAYASSPGDAAEIRTSCAVYLAGRSDARSRR